jgi:hypothetical protein
MHARAIANQSLQRPVRLTSCASLYVCMCMSLPRARACARAFSVCACALHACLGIAGALGGAANTPGADIRDEHARHVGECVERCAHPTPSPGLHSQKSFLYSEFYTVNTRALTLLNLWQASRRATSAMLSQYPTPSSTTSSPGASAAPLKVAVKVAAADGLRADADRVGGGAGPSEGNMQAVLAALAKENSALALGGEGGRGASGGGARAAAEGGILRPFPRLPSAKKVAVPAGGGLLSSGGAVALASLGAGAGEGAAGGGARGFDRAAGVGVGEGRERGEGRETGGGAVEESVLAARLRSTNSETYAVY